MKPTPKLSRLIREYPAEWLECWATSRHDLEGLRVQTDTGARVYRITEVCSRCGMVRRQTLTFGGLLVHAETSYVRPDGYDVPDAPGVVLTHVMTKNLSGPGTIEHVVNGVGGSVDGVADPGDADGAEDPSYVVSYRNGVAVLP